MTKAIFIAAAAAFCLASTASAAEQFSPRVINLYAQPNDAKPTGKLLPTNAFSAKCDGQMCELTIEGLYNAEKGKALYVSAKNRILVAAFSKKAEVQIAPAKPDATGFSKASITAYAKASELEGAQDSVEPLFERAKNLFAENCGTCHALHATTEFSANQWPGNFKAMQSRTAIEKEDIQLVVQYLQKHAKDMK